MRISILCIPLLAACVQAAPAPEHKPTYEGKSCGADGYQNLIGQSANLLAAMTFPAPMRVIRPGMAVTMDYLEQRLNIYLEQRLNITVDKNNKISSVYCG